MSDTPKDEDEEKPVAPAGYSSTLFELIDWVFHAGAPIGGPEEENEEGDGDESVSGDDDQK